MGKTKIKPVEEQPLEETTSVIPSDSEGSQDEKQSVSPSGSRDSSASPQNDNTETPVVDDKPKKKQKRGKARIRSKKYKEAIEKVDRNINYPLLEAVELVKNTSFTTFPGTVELHLNSSLKGLRGLVTLPFSTGKKLRILVLAPAGTKLDEKEVTVGDEASLEEISKGKVDFDVIVAHPSFMPKLAPLAKILGPRGLMPNPKTGTVTENLDKAIEDLMGGKVEYKTEANGKVIHTGVGITSQPSEELSANVKALYTIVGKSKVQKITLSSTMGPGVKVDLASI